ncbi:uncharacterized protein LOC135704083 [Ochlerotatus camptorhynchus]|uniref:uncharacterized protein LOC135704083 n=1 Tax=Ochlerotatus camptorhynchus TaxID=644619 RepID=UPI0031D81F37
MSSSSDALSIFNDQTSPEKKRYDFSFSLPSPVQPVQPMDVDTSGPIRLSPPTTTTGNRPSEKKQKLNSGKAKAKIRKLMSQDDDDVDGAASVGTGGFLKKLVGVRMLVAYSLVLLVAVLAGIVSKEDLREDFYRRYRKQYHLLLYGVEDYCSQEFDFSPVAAALDAGVVGQWTAVERIVDIFNRRQEERFTSIALLGSTGVGKSLMASIVAQNFQWLSNVHQFLWEALATPERQYDRFQSFLYGIRHGREVDLSCGRNLIVVDHLGSDDVELINKIDTRLRFVANNDDVRMTVLYVFQGASLKDDRRVGQLNGPIERVVLRQLNGEDLMQCIRQEAAEFGVELSEHPGLMEELLTNMDVAKYGCKAVRAKVAFYSQHSKQNAL